MLHVSLEFVIESGLSDFDVKVEATFVYGCMNCVRDNSEIIKKVVTYLVYLGRGRIFCMPKDTLSDFQNLLKCILRNSSSLAAWKSCLLSFSGLQTLF